MQQMVIIYMVLPYAKAGDVRCDIGGPDEGINHIL